MSYNNTLQWNQANTKGGEHSDKTYKTPLKATGTSPHQSVEEMKNVDPRTVDRSQLVDRESVRLDPDAGYEERLKSHIRQIRNPYCYLDGGIVVKLAFQPKGPTIEERVNSVYLSGS